MICRLCLTASECIVEIFREENIQKYITKFLKLELTPDDPVSKVICTLCWQQLENFQTFYIRVEEAQKSLSAAHQQLKVEGGHHVSELTQDMLLKLANTGSSEIHLTLQDIKSKGLNLLKEENDLKEKSDDESIDNDDILPCLDEEIVKVELHNEPITESLTTTLPIVVVPPCTRRTTRGSVLKRQTTIDENETLFEEIKIQRKSCRTKTVKKVDQINTQNDERDEENNVDISTKRRRGRPRKGEERPKIIKVRSEKTEKILETAKEFDEIIKKNMNLTCNVCAEHLVDFAELKRHFRIAHNRKGYAVCCNKRLYKRGLVVDHINVHNNPEHFKCPECGKIMADRMCLRNHVLLMHQNEDDKIYQCPFCPKKYAKQYLLDHHQVKHVPQDQCTFICTVCQRGFPTKTTLKKHLNQIHSTIYDKMCEICAKLIRGKAAFKRHMEEHEGIVQPQVQCEICGSWLKDKNSLRKHMYKHDGKSYSCNVCGKSAPSKSALQSHQKYVHQAVRKFHCTFCDKSFKKAVNLREHLTTHTGEVLYTCPHCPKTFNSKANMHAHRKKKHREEWEANKRYNVKQLKPTKTEPI